MIFFINKVYRRVDADTYLLHNCIPVDVLNWERNAKPSIWVKMIVVDLSSTNTDW